MFCQGCVLRFLGLCGRPRRGYGDGCQGDLALMLPEPCTSSCPGALNGGRYSEAIRAGTTFWSVWVKSCRRPRPPATPGRAPAFLKMPLSRAILRLSLVLLLSAWVLPWRSSPAGDWQIRRPQGILKVVDLFMPSVNAMLNYGEGLLTLDGENRW
jgi:hypothetical protein